MNILLVFTGFIVAFIIVFYYERKIRRTVPRNKVHFYVARDKNGSLWLYLGKPIRRDSIFSVSYGTYGSCLINKCHFKYFGLNENDFDNLKWEDEPVEVFINMED